MRKEKNNITAFDSLADLAAYGREDTRRVFQYDKCDDWNGHISGNQALSMCSTGDTTQVAAAQKLLDKFDIHIETTGRQMDVGCAGFMPCIPEFLGGAPECMYTMADAKDDSKPLKIIVNLVCSAGVETHELNKRGTVILAAAMALAAIRPVQLEVIATVDSNREHALPNGDRVATARVAINSTPLDLASACYALCHPGFVRHLLYGVGVRDYGSPLGWPYSPHCDMSLQCDPKTISHTLQMLGEPEETTLYIPGLYLGDPLVHEPEKWVEAVLKKYGSQPV